MEKYYIHLQGTGQKNGVVTIDKKFEVKYNEIGKYTNSSTSKEYIQKALDFYYPGLQNHTVNFAKVISEKIKTPKNSEDFENFIAGVTTGAVVSKLSESKKNISTVNENHNSFSKELKKYSEISFAGKDINETKNLLNQIYNAIIDYKWEDTGKDEKLNRIIEKNNHFLNMCLENYSFGIKHLKEISNNEAEIEHFSKLFIKLKRKKIFKKYGIILIALSALVLMIFVLYLMEN